MSFEFKLYKNLKSFNLMSLPVLIIHFKYNIILVMQELFVPNCDHVNTHPLNTFNTIIDSKDKTAVTLIP